MFTQQNRALIRLLVLVVALGLAPAAMAQQVWLQVESVRTQAQAEDRAARYASEFPGVASFRIGSGWYAISLGPYESRAIATTELRALRRAGRVPSDAYVATGNAYSRQVWPVGATLTPQVVAPSASLDEDSVQADPLPSAQSDLPAAEEEAEVVIIDETPREARASERGLDAATRRELQEALRWEGLYTAAIDGAFGAGTRRAMGAWQEAQGYDVTGVLTRRQREEVLATYRAPFESLGLASISDTAAGIEMILPMGRVAFARTEAPFIHYDATDGGAMRAILISQTGTEATLFGLYDILQTLEIIPQDGPRERKKSEFTIEGRSPDSRALAYAQLSGGAVKGYILTWDPRVEDERVVTRTLVAMKDSFRPLLGQVLPDTAHDGDGSDQRIDLLAGLEIRRPDVARTGFFVDTSGSVLTTTEVVGQCSRVTLGKLEEVEAEVAARDDALGLALLRPAGGRLAPIRVAAFAPSVPRLQSEVAVSGFAYEDVLDLPTITFGRLADIRGLAGEENLQRLDLTHLPGDAGGPVLDQTGAVLGMLRAAETGGARQLPPGVSFSVGAPAIAEFLDSAGLQPTRADAFSALPPEDLTALAADMTILVSCWN